MQKLPHTKSCYACGESNPLGLKLLFETDGKVVRAEFIPRPEHSGFKDTIHGGVLATLLDEAMAWACAAQTKRWAYCAELTVRYREPARPRKKIMAVAELVEDRRGKIFKATGELRREDGTILAAATGKYLPLKEPLDMTDELIGDPALISP
jgi:uncharacterized protein (TIGR00369 family)